MSNIDTKLGSKASHRTGRVALWNGEEERSSEKPGSSRSSSLCKKLKKNRRQTIKKSPSISSFWWGPDTRSSGRLKVLNTAQEL